MKKIILFMLVCLTLCSCNKEQHKVENCGIYYDEVKMHDEHEYYLYYKSIYSTYPFDVEHKIDCKKCLDLFD